MERTDYQCTLYDQIFLKQVCTVAKRLKALTIADDLITSVHLFVFVSSENRAISLRANKKHVCTKPRRPPMTNTLALLNGTESAFRQVHASESPLCMHFQESKRLLGSEVSWCDHGLARTPKEAFSEVRVHSATTQVAHDFDVVIERQPPTDSPPFDHYGEGNGKKEFRKKWKKGNLFVFLRHRSDSDENAIIDCEFACDCVNWQTWSSVKKIMPRLTQSLTSRLLLSEWLTVRDV